MFGWDWDSSKEEDSSCPFAMLLRRDDLKGFLFILKINYHFDDKVLLSIPKQLHKRDYTTDT